MSTVASQTRHSRLRSAVSWLRQMRAALEVGAPRTNNDPCRRTREFDRAVNRLRAFGIDPRI